MSEAQTQLPKDERLNKLWIFILKDIRTITNTFLRKVLPTTRRLSQGSWTVSWCQFVNLIVISLPVSHPPDIAASQIGITLCRQGRCPKKKWKKKTDMESCTLCLCFPYLGQILWHVGAVSAPYFFFILRPNIVCLAVFSITPIWLGE